MALSLVKIPAKRIWATAQMNLLSNQLAELIRYDKFTSQSWAATPIIGRPCLFRSLSGKHPPLVAINLPHSHDLSSLPRDEPVAHIRMSCFQIFDSPITSRTIFQIRMSVCYAINDLSRFRNIYEQSPRWNLLGNRDYVRHFRIDFHSLLLLCALFPTRTALGAEKKSGVPSHSYLT